MFKNDFKYKKMANLFVHEAAEANLEVAGNVLNGCG